MYRIGDTVPLSFRVINRQLSLLDATVTLTIEQPTGADVTPSVVRDGVGQYSALFVPTQPGRHVVRWLATGAHNQAETDVLNIAAGASPVEIISLAEAKEHLNMDAEQSAEDGELRSFIAAASRVVEQYLKQVIARRTIVEDHVLDGTGTVLLQAAPVVSLTSVTAPDGTELDVAGMSVDAANGIVSVAASGPQRFTFVAGYAVVPDNIIKATQIICAHLWSTQRVQTVGATPGFGGSDMAAAPVSGRGYLIPNQAAQLLGGRAPNSP